MIIFKKTLNLVLLMISLTLIFASCDEDKDNVVVVRVYGVNSDFTGSYTKNSGTSVALSSTDSGYDLYYQDITLKKVNTLTLSATATDDYDSTGSTRIYLYAYIFEDMQLVKETKQVDYNDDGQNITFTLTFE